MRHLAGARGDPVFPAKNLLGPRGGVLKNKVQSYGAFKAHGITPLSLYVMQCLSGLLVEKIFLEVTSSSVVVC